MSHKVPKQRVYKGARLLNHYTFLFYILTHQPLPIPSPWLYNLNYLGGQKEVLSTLDMCRSGKYKPLESEGILLAVNIPFTQEVS